MPNLTPEQVAELAIAQGLSTAVGPLKQGITSPCAISVAISMAEEGAGDPNALGDTTIEDATWGPSVGLWQIRTLKKNPPWYRDLKQLQGSPQLQAHAMQVISANGTSWGPWTTYTDGAYLVHLRAANDAVAAAKSGGAVSQVGQDEGVATPGVGPLTGPQGLLTNNPLSQIASVLSDVSSLLSRIFSIRGLEVLAGLGAITIGILILNRDTIGAGIRNAAQNAPEIAMAAA